jgi:GDPmannose 4,6-dehydratase
VKALIFGAGGQDGHYLHELCKLKGIEPIGVSRSGGWVHGDVSRFDQVEGLIRQHEPAYVFHVAANSTTRHDALFENHETISTGALNVLEAVRRHCPGARVFITGSGLQFKNSGRPISEQEEFEASSPYSVARIQSVYAARYYRSLGVRAYVGYLFHHESPLRKPNHVSRMIALAVRRIAAGSAEIIELGDISVTKEWTFAGDVAEAIMMLVEQDDCFEAAIGSGKGYTIEEWLVHCFALIGKEWRDHVRLKEGFRAEYPVLLSDPATMGSIGWRAKTDIGQLAAMMMSA